MAAKKPVLTLTFKAAADLSSKQYRAMVADSTNLDSVTVDATGNVAILGVLQNKPKSGEQAEVDVLGLTKGLLGGTVNNWALVKTDNEGRFIAGGGGGDKNVGRAHRGGASGEIGEIMLFDSPFVT